jgi:hypothetical protein
MRNHDPKNEKTAYSRNPMIRAASLDFNKI